MIYCNVCLKIINIPVIKNEQSIDVHCPYCHQISRITSVRLKETDLTPEELNAILPEQSRLISDTMRNILPSAMQEELQCNAMHPIKNIRCGLPKHTGGHQNGYLHWE